MGKNEKRLVPQLDLSQLEQQEVIQYRLCANAVRREVEKVRSVARDLNCHVESVPAANIDFESVKDLISEGQQAMKELAIANEKALRERKKIIGR